MRPVDLIPAEERRGGRAPLRSGPLPYILLGAMVAVLAAVTALVLTGNRISDREAELSRLRAADAVASRRAAELAPYVAFARGAEARALTVASLAESRFDWERVMRELSLVLPDDAWLVSLEASAGGSGPEGGGVAAGVAGPALKLSGCATGQEAVARFVTALKGIDGVTRVGLQSSQLGSDDAGANGGGQDAGGNGGTECRTREFIARFELVVAFDAAPVPSTAAPAPEAAEAAPEDSEAEGEASAEEGAATVSAETEGGG